MASVSGGPSQGSGDQLVQEYIVRVPKATKKKFHVMGFPTDLESNKWMQVRMERENNLKEFRAEEDIPKFGAGSEFGRDAKEEARRKKFGYISKNYNPDDQPWIMQLGGKGGKKYRGIRGGGVTENTSFYVFMQAPDGAFEAYPLNEWYNFKPMPRYKALSAEEAEEEFGRRDKVVNYFSIMLKKRLNLKQEEDDPLDGEEKPQKGKKKKNKEEGRNKGDLKLTDMDDWFSDSEENSDEENEEKGEGDEDKNNKKGKNKGKQGKGGKGKPKKKKKEKGSDEEALEESDEGDFDDREVDYMSDSSSSSGEEPDEKANKQLKGVEDEEALLKLNLSDEDEEEEQNQQNNAEEKDKKEEDGKKENNGAEDKTKPEAKTKEKAPKKGGSSGESSAESSDSDFDDSKFQSAMFMQKAAKRNGSDNSGNNSRANTPTKSGPDGSAKIKRKQTNDNNNACSPSKKSKHDSSSAGSSTEGITEDAVRRYLMRKPMTTTELLQKFRSKKTGLSGIQLVNTIAQILKRLNPQKQTIKGKLYLSIKQ